jgi:MarR family transcriptional regulator for hemolysin
MDDDRCCQGDLCWLLSQASHHLTTRMAAGFESIGLGPREHHVLAAALEGEHSQIELARMVGLDKTTMVVILDELEARGLAERRPSPRDRRARVIAVTEAGRAKVAEAQAIADRIRDEVLAVLGDDERETFLRALRTLVSDPLAAPAACVHPVRRRRAPAPVGTG